MTFSGHDTFHWRLFWFKKGFDYVFNGEKFRYCIRQMDSEKVS